MLYLIKLLICLVILTCFVGCSSMNGEDIRDGIISRTGTIMFINLEGGFFGIIGDDGINYNPINLSEDFRVDDLRVQFEAEILDDVASIRMWGIQIEIIEIKKLE